MERFTLVAVIAFASMAASANSNEAPEMVWPINEVNVSDSYLPAVVQVLSYLLEDLYDLNPPQETSNSTDSASSSSPSAEQHESSTEPAAPANASSTAVPSATADSVVAPDSMSLTSSAGINTSTGLPTVSSAEPAESAVTVTSTAAASTNMSAETSTQTVSTEENQESTDEGSTTTEALYVRPSLAYVMLGRLRDVLSNESKRQGFSKIQGFSSSVLDALVKSSYGTSVSQLRTLLCTMLENNDVKRKNSVIHSKTVLSLLNEPSNFLVNILENVPPLSYSTI